MHDRHRARTTVHFIFSTRTPQFAYIAYSSASVQRYAPITCCAATRQHLTPIEPAGQKLSFYGKVRKVGEARIS